MIAAVVVTYNRLELLKTNLDLLLQQRYPLDKIYIVDNASTDGTSIFCEEASTKFANVEYIRLNQNGGGQEALL